MQKKGFTLIELMITIAIIGILAAISIPAYIGQQKNATRTEAYSNLQNLRLLEEQFFAENGSYTTIGNLRGWRPGADANLAFTYNAGNVVGVGLPNPVPLPYLTSATINLPSNTTPCFIGTAIGKTGTRVDGDGFAIDCNNNKNF